MASKYEEKKSSRDPVGHASSTAQPDVVAMRLEVDDLCPLPPSVRELEFNVSSPEIQGADEHPPTTSTKLWIEYYNFIWGKYIS